MANIRLMKKTLWTLKLDTNFQEQRFVVLAGWNLVYLQDSLMILRDFLAHGFLEINLLLVGLQFLISGQHTEILEL